jgi:outer membrane protein OmpA-like peptidoglycan-associated protein
MGAFTEFGNAETQEFELYPELFPEFETGFARPRLPLRRPQTPSLSPRRVAQVAPTTNPACLLRRDSDILDFFNFNASALRPFHIKEIRDITARIVATFSSPSPVREVVIIGHTDERGTDKFNLELGEKRARSVQARLLQELGANAPRVLLLSGSRGENSAIAPNSFDRGRACNRRVEIFFGCQTGKCAGRSFRDFFMEYDLRTFPSPPDRPFGIDSNPNMTPAQKAQRKSDVISVIRVLMARRQNRAAAALNQPATTPVPPLNVDAAKRLSDAQIELFFESFPAPGGTLDLALLRQAFYDFANGDLRTPEIGPNKGVGEPDSSAFFLFAEFAFLCIEQGIRAPVWTEILPWLVSAQEVFMHVYRRPPHPAPPVVGAQLPPVCSPPRQLLSSYTFKNFDGRGVSSEQRKSDLARKYLGMKLDQMKNAANENLLRAQCMP